MKESGVGSAESYSAKTKSLASSGKKRKNKIEEEDAKRRSSSNLGMVSPRDISSV